MPSDTPNLPPPSGRWPRPQRDLPFRHAIRLIVLTACYFAAGKFGLALAIVHPSASAVWAPTGIAIAAILAMGYRSWPAIFLGAFLVNVTTAGSIATSIGIAAGNTSEACLAAWLVNRFAGGPNPFDRASDTFRFAFLAGMVATLASATIGVSSLAIGGFARWADFAPIWLTWWLGDLGGAVVVAPLLILWSRNPRLTWTKAQALEAFALVLVLMLVGFTVFRIDFPVGAKNHPFAFLCMPVLVWAAFRFDQRMASAAIFAFSAIAVSGTLRAPDNTGHLELNASLVVLQIFMAVAAVTALALAALVADRRRVEAAVRATSSELRDALTDLETFMHSISHDLRSPVGAVLNYTSVIEEDFGGQLGGDAIRLLRRIETSAKSAQSLLDQLVQLGWAGRDRGAGEPVDMTLLAREVLVEIRAGSDEASEVHFEFRDLPPARGSVALLRCVFRNLFSNAVKYTRGRPNRRVEVAALAGERENTYCVADNGIGFLPGQGDRVFQPFQRLIGAREIEGAGVGLAIAEKIIRTHRGRIWAESDGSTGARFSFTLPRVDGESWPA